MKYKRSPATGQLHSQVMVIARKAPLSSNNQVLCLSTSELRKTLLRVNPRKAAGPELIQNKADVLTDVFDISLSTTVVPTCFKTTTIIPVSKNSQ